MALRQLDSNVTLRKTNRFARYLAKTSQEEEEEEENANELDEIERLFKNDVKPVGRSNRRLDDKEEYVSESPPYLESPLIGQQQAKLKLKLPGSESDSEKENVQQKRQIKETIKPMTKRVKQPDPVLPDTNETVISSNRNAKGSSIVIAKINKSKAVDRLGVKEPFASASTPINEAAKVVSVFDSTTTDTTEQMEENNSDLFGSPIAQFDSRRQSTRSNVSKKTYCEPDESDEDKTDYKFVDVKNLKLFEEEQDAADEEYKPSVLKTTSKKSSKKATKPKQPSSRKAPSKTTTKKSKSSKYDDVLVDKDLEEWAKEYESIKNYKLIVEHVAHD